MALVASYAFVAGAVAVWSARLLLSMTEGMEFSISAAAGMFCAIAVFSILWPVSLALAAGGFLLDLLARFR